MRSRCYTIRNLEGLHARPSAVLIKIAQAHGCRLLVKVKDQWQEAGIMNLLMLCAHEGAALELAADGGDEEKCLKEIKRVLEG